MEYFPTLRQYFLCPDIPSHCKIFDLSGLYQVLPDQAQPVPVPLVGVEVSAVVRNFIAEVELRQKYQSKENIFI